MRTPAWLKSSNGFVTIAVSPAAITCISAGAGSSARSIMSRYIRRPVSLVGAGNICAEVIVCTSRPPDLGPVDRRRRASTSAIRARSSASS